MTSTPAAMTRPFAFTGRGDDVVEVESDGWQGVFDAYGGARLRLTSMAERAHLLVVCELLEDTGTWVVAPTMVSEACPLPDWDVVWGAGTDGSPCLVVHAPEDTVVEATHSL